jgi:NAD(P)-dependent dehydrogenase (short-subunit alcohol dehydrogenase family)
VAAQQAQGTGVLDGRTILVTGAGSGIGWATAVLAAGGWCDCDRDGCARRGTDRGSGGEVEAHALDVTDATAWRTVAESVLGSRGRIHGLANVAGVVSDVDNLLDQTEEGWDRLVTVDLKGPWLGMRAVIRHMLDAGGGKIVDVASVAGLIGMPNVLAYSAAKGGVIAMSRQAAVEYAARNIQVNVVAPGVTRTPMLGDITPELLAAVTAATPSGRIGDPADVASLIVYLLGSGSDFITGQVFIVDGGWTAQ